MEKTGWKITAIIFIVLFLITWGIIAWGLQITLEEERLTNECYYDFCSGYEQADYDLTTNVCSCYEPNYETYQYDVAKTRYMK